MLVRAIGACLATIAAFAALGGQAMADKYSEGHGQPILSGDLHSEAAHGVVHCQPIGESLGSSKAESAGVIVVNPNQTHVAAPAGGTCEQIYAVLFGG